MSGEIEAEEERTREEVAEYLEEVVEGLREGGEMTVAVGNPLVDVNPADDLMFEVEVEDEDEERSVEFELTWLRQNDEVEIHTE